MKASDYLSGSVDPVIRPLLQLCIEEKPADFQAWLLDKLKGGDGSAGMALSGGGGSGPKGRGNAKRRNSIDLSHKESGRRNSLEYRITTVKDDDEEAVISLWNDAPLYSTDDTTGARNGLFNFVNEIPKYTRKKYELATDERGNPIKQDEKKGVLREFKRGDMMFNYGFFPRTWEDPDYVHPDTMAAGDNDPLDVCEVGLRQIPTGSVREVKVLGILAMIDEGETDWKVVVIDSEDPWAGMMNDISDLDKHVPGTTHMIREWFRLYKVPDGKPENKFGLDERFEDQRYAKMIIEETHQAWKELSKKDEGESKLILKRRPSMRKLGELGVRRVSSVGVSLIDGTAAPMPAQPVKPEGKPSARTGRRKSITNAIAPKTTGVEGTHEYRLQTYKENDLGAAVSLWHDIPLYVEDSAGKVGARHLVAFVS
jgi:inorganic pyrophosphatase